MTDRPDHVAGAQSAPPAPPSPTRSPVAPAPPPAVTGWGQPPGMAPSSRPPGPRGTSGKTSLVVLGVILGVLLGANLVDAALPLPQDPSIVDAGPGIPTEPQPGGEPQPSPVQPGPVEPGDGLDVGGGFDIFPPGGWTSVGSEDGTVLQKGSVLLIVAGFSWEQSATDLASAYRDAWFEDGQFTGDDPETGSVGNGIPAAGLNYTGTWNGTQVDGAIIAAAAANSGLIINVVGPTGSLNAVSSDLDTILGTVQHAGG